jgi:hypothetical protein
MSNARFGLRVRSGSVGSIIQGLPDNSFLLDQYPISVAAFSFRLLRRNYSGSCIRVRRSSDNLEQDIGFNNNAILDIDSLTSFTSGGDSYISRWYDQSGNQRHLSQTALLSQPQIVYAGVVSTYNNKIVLNSSTNKNLIATGFTFNTLVNQLGIFGVTLLPVTGGGLLEFATTDNSGTPNFLFRNNSTNIQIWTNGAYFLSGNKLANPYNLVSLLSITGNWQLYLNDTSVGTGSRVNAGTAPLRLFSGVPGFYNSIVQEIVFYSTDQTSNRVGIQANINSYYNIY